MNDYDETRPSLIACIFWDKLEKGLLWEGIEQLINDMIDIEFVTVTRFHLIYQEQATSDINKKRIYQKLIEVCDKRIKDIK